MKFIIFLCIEAGGYLAIRYFKWIVDHTMRFESVEKFLGAGGTYTFWKIAGLLAMFAGFYYLVNM